MPAARYVILPADNRYNFHMRSPSLDLWRGAQGASMAGVTGAGVAAAPARRAVETVLPVRNVVSRIGDDEALLVTLTDRERLDLRREYPGLTLVEDAVARMANMQWVLQPISESGMAGTARPRQELRVRVVAPNGKPLARRTVLAITDASTHPPTGASTETDAKGVARFLLPAQSRVQRVIVENSLRHWGTSWSANGKRPRELELVCKEVDPTAQDDGLRRLHRAGAAGDGEGVTVAVVDGGATHAALEIDGGANLTDAGPADDLSDNGIGHGTHVAGIIAGQPDRGTPAGLAPGVRLRVYRAFAKNTDRTGSFAVAAAIRRAVDDGADLVNVSITVDDPDIRVVESEVKRARAKGAVCIAAAGNDAGPVKFPARLPGAIGVSAVGMRIWPKGVGPFEVSSSPIAKQNRKLGVASFTCRGPEIDLTAPGVAVVSLLPRGYGAMDGTSMAAPAITGLLARKLSRNPGLLGADRDQRRSDAIVSLAARIATSVGLPAIWEGHGILPD
jgi:subtilisin